MTPDSPASELILDAIANEGPLRFSRYMDLALYHPVGGFYANGGAGRRKDFITSPEVGPLFGAVIANALDATWDELGQPERFAVVEAGAGPGTLARAIQRAGPRCIDAMDYLAVEQSAVQRERHPSTVNSSDAMPDQIGPGVVFANELLDNLPFDVLDYDPARGWLEVRVGQSGGLLTEVLEPVLDHDLPPATPTQPVRVPVQRDAATWLVTTLGALTSGRVIVVDYGVAYPAYDRQWLRTYAEHDRGHDPLMQPGSRDITADIDIDALVAVRMPDTIHTQAEFLARHGIEQLVAEGNAYWEAHAARPDVAAMAMRSRSVEAQALLDPTGLGGFVVLEWVAGSSLARGLADG